MRHDFAQNNLLYENESPRFFQRSPVTMGIRTLHYKNIYLRRYLHRRSLVLFEFIFILICLLISDLTLFEIFEFFVVEVDFLQDLLDHNFCPFA
jgi:hypothetical protein